MEERTFALVISPQEEQMKQLPQTVTAAQAAVIAAKCALQGVSVAAQKVVREAEEHLITALRSARVPTILVEHVDYDHEEPRECEHFLVTTKVIPIGARIVAVGHSVEIRYMGPTGSEAWLDLYDEDEWGDPDAELIPASPTYFRELDGD